MSGIIGSGGGDPGNPIVIYNTDDGRASVRLLSKDGSVWLSQSSMAELFDTTVPNVSMHISNILKTKELDQDSVVKNYLTTALDGKSYNVAFYSLDMILAVGFRVRSKRGVQFRRWANVTLKEYMQKGFAMDDERLKNPDGCRDITVKFWRENVDGIISYNKKPLLVGKGSVSGADMEKAVNDVYDKFSEQRNLYERNLADEQDMQELTLLEEGVKYAKRGARLV